MPTPSTIDADPSGQARRTVAPRRFGAMPRARRQAFLLLLPATLVLAGLTLYPLARGLGLSLFDTDYGFAGARFVGGLNYVELAGDRFFNRAVWNTVWFTLLATTSEVAFGLVLALLVNRHFPGRGLVITLLIAPFVLSTMVVTAIWRAWMHYDLGYLNNLLRAIGLDGVPWLFDPDLALYSLVLVDLWQTAPIAFLILLAGLQTIDREIYEAARIDGASPLQTFRTITLPLLLPYILLAALLRSIESFKIFDKVFALTGGGPGHATETLSLYLYRLGFSFFEIGLASAVAVIMLVIAGALAAVYAASILRQESRRD